MMSGPHADETPLPALVLCGQVPDAGAWPRARGWARRREDLAVAMLTLAAALAPRMQGIRRFAARCADAAPRVRRRPLRPDWFERSHGG